MENMIPTETYSFRNRTLSFSEVPTRMHKSVVHTPILM